MPHNMHGDRDGVSTNRMEGVKFKAKNAIFRQFYPTTYAQRPNNLR